MFNSKKNASAAIAIVIALGALVSSPALAAPSQSTAQKEIVKLDTTTTGSVTRSNEIRNCDPSSANASFICKVTRGDPNAKFPSAPATNFGF